MVFIQALIFIIGLFIFKDFNTLNTFVLSLLAIAILTQVYFIAPYLPFRKFTDKSPNNEAEIKLISVNVLQKNKNYKSLIQLVEKVKPAILLTMETNETWEQEMHEIEEKYAYNFKIPKENRYGMHFYSNLKIIACKVHYFISDERPAIEVKLADKNQNEFIFYGVHPPPPSPTEKPTAKQKDAELMQVGKLIAKQELPCIVTGDFNNVCWSKSAKVFAKISKLKDARLGRGIHGTFPVKPWIFRFPLDLLFVSKAINVDKIGTLPSIGSDHLPFYAAFNISNPDADSKHTPSKKLKKEADRIIKAGKKAHKAED
ncbi:endonuclease/exonuclease/phosphatase family protein [Putridiphycobacter roseus]|uniref:Endonuclease/exonuclease/phosphatase family protein n=2 Tax=Putridiphycobacter roseus TaxID=2219161 RepID=A0A2W1NQM7_9FLAO|nr:endonuclease/exonuclease/phosphatase family protein [Putridiphycobacter roseus]